MRHFDWRCDLVLATMEMHGHAHFESLSVRTLLVAQQQLSGSVCRGNNRGLRNQVSGVCAHVGLADVKIVNTGRFSPQQEHRRQTPLVTKREPQSHPYSHAAFRR